jgi:hypothetical protein
MLRAFCELALYRVCAVNHGSSEWMTLRMTRSCGGVNQASVLLRGVHHTSYPCTFAVAHKIYGIPQTINTATYVFFLAYEKLFVLRNHATFPPTKEIEAIVTGMLVVIHPDGDRCNKSQRNFCLSIAVRALKFYGVIPCNALQKKSIYPW